MSPNPETFICFKCKHFREFSGGCKAFPSEIPFGMGVLFNHDKPLPNQNNNIVFEEGEPTEF